MRTRDAISLCNEFMPPNDFDFEVSCEDDEERRVIDTVVFLHQLSALATRLYAMEWFLGDLDGMLSKYDEESEKFFDPVVLVKFYHAIPDSQSAA